MSDRPDSEAAADHGLRLFTHDGWEVIQPSGHLDERLEADLVQACAGQLDAYGAAVIDMSQVRYVNSAGLSVLVRIVAGANAARRRVVLVAPTSFVAQLFRSTMLDRFFTIAADLDVALARLRD